MTKYKNNEYQELPELEQREITVLPEDLTIVTPTGVGDTLHISKFCDQPIYVDQIRLFMSGEGVDEHIRVILLFHDAEDQDYGLRAGGAIAKAIAKHVQFTQGEYKEDVRILLGKGFQKKTSPNGYTYYTI